MEKGEASYSLTFDKLTEENYEAWNFNMRMMLCDRGLWPFIDGSAVPPAETASAEVKEKYNLRKQRALSTIAMGVSTDVQRLIRETVSGKEAWDQLKEAFQPKSRVRILNLKRQFVNVKLKEGETMTAYLGRLKVCASQLDEAGATVLDTDLAYSMVAGLPDSYDPVVTQFNTADDAQFTSKAVRQALLVEYERRISRKQEEECIQAFETSSFKGKQPNVTNIREKEIRKTKFKGNCYNCGKYGHSIKFCRFKNQSHKDKNQVKRSTKGGKDKDEAFFSALHASMDTDVWLIDSGATNHFSNKREWFHNFKKTDYKEVTIGQGTSNIEGMGDILLKAKVHGNFVKIWLKDVMYTPNLRKNLISVRMIDKKGYNVLIAENEIQISNPNHKVIGLGYVKNDLYVIDAVTVLPHGEAHYVSTQITVEKWHKRFCHVGYHDINKMIDGDYVHGLENTKKGQTTVCHDCCIGKATKAPHKPIGRIKTKEVLELVHTDLWGPSPVESIRKGKYFLSFIDDYSRRATVYILQNKNEVTKTFKQYKLLVERETGKRIKRLRSDNGLEFCNRELEEYCEQQGITHETTNIYSPQMNGIAERFNRTVMDLVNTNLHAAKLPKFLWAEILHAVTYVKNRSPHSALNGVVPQERWSGHKPSIRHLRIIGSVAFAHIPKQKRNKLDPRAEKYIMVGYAIRTYGYRLWKKNTKEVIETKHVTFDEDAIDVQDQKVKESDELTISLNQIPDSDLEEWTNENIDIGEDDSSGESGQQKRKGRPLKIIRNPYGRAGKPKPQVNFTQLVIPETFEEAQQSDQAKEWQKAMEEEIKTHLKRGTWEPAELPPNQQAITCKWVYTLKKDEDGKIKHYKASP